MAPFTSLRGLVPDPMSPPLLRCLSADVMMLKIGSLADDAGSLCR
jgi:hypothetical protein